MNASYRLTKAARVRHPHEEATQVDLQTVARADELADALEFLCRAMEEESVDRVIACIHPLNEDATMFRDTVAPSLDKSYRESTDGVLVSSMTAPCCQAVATRQTAVVPDLAADPKWAKFRELADPLGIRSAWSTPIFSNEGKVLGTFAHYYFEVRDPSPHDERMVKLLSRAAAVAIERSRVEAALREVNETLEQRIQAEMRERLQIWSISQDLLVISDLGGKFLRVNPAWTAVLGWSEDDLVGKSAQLFLHPDDWETTRTELGHLAGGRKSPRFENRLLARDGSYHWISWNAAPDNGRIYGMGRDITERKQAEEQLRHVIDTMPTLAWCNLPDGTNEFLNKNWHEYTGLSPEESHGWGWQAAFHREDLPPLMERWKRMLISGEPDEIEARLRRNDGVYRWFLIRAEPFRDEAGRRARSFAGMAPALTSMIESAQKSSCAAARLFCALSIIDVSAGAIPAKDLARLPASSRNGSARMRNQRYTPSLRRRRASISSGSPEINIRFHLSIKGGKSSGWNAACQPQPCDSSGERPVYSCQFLFRNSFVPSGRLHQANVGIVSITCRNCSSACLRSVMSRPMP